MKLTAVFALATIGCASAAPVVTSPPTGLPASVTGDETVNVRLAPESDAMQSVIKADQEKVWALLPDIYEKLGIGGQVLDGEARRFGTQKFTSRTIGGMRINELVRCGNDAAGPSGGMYRTNLSIVTSVEGRIDGNTSIFTQIEGYATPAEGTSTEPVRCVSNGRLEKKIRELITERLRS